MEGEIAGIIKDKQEGKLEGKLEIARNMFLEGMTTAQIVKLTALPEAEIIKLRQKLKTMTGH
jgi:predicted transposase YdaD